MSDRKTADAKKVLELTRTMSGQLGLIQRAFQDLEQKNALLRNAINDESYATVAAYIAKVQSVLTEAVPHFQTVSRGMEEYAELIIKGERALE